MDQCKQKWRELHGVALLPLALGSAGTLGRGSAGGNFILASRGQQQLLPQLKNKFVHLKAARRLARFMECNEFLQIMGIRRFSKEILAESLHLVLPRGWRNETFVQWDQAPGNSRGGSGGGGTPPTPLWLAAFWREISFSDVSGLPALAKWPLLPITTGELVSCSFLPQVLY
ncbi:unnamed protein product [Discosporangium mesarthrocarpum]